MDYYISKSILKSGAIKEYSFLNKHFKEATDDCFPVLDIVKSAKHRLGLNENAYGIWQLSAKVGAIWLDKAQQVPIVVEPKIIEIDAVKMYLTLTGNNRLFKSYHTVFQCFPDEPAIKGEKRPDVTLLQIAVFLRELSQFCQRDLRQGFVRVRQNLIGKVKGKVLIGENLRMNTLNAREDRVACQFHVMSLDTPANRILKAALMRCYGYLSKEGKHYPVLLQWARQCYAALSEVTDSSILETDFHSIVYSGLMRKYQRPHQYARMILKRLRTDASGQDTDNSTVPYVLDMNRLFEGYVGVLLAKTGIDFKVQSANLSLGGDIFNIRFRPDYYAIDEGVVVDAKYKSILIYDKSTQDFDGKDEHISFQGQELVEAKPNNMDIYQVIAYCKLLESEYKDKVFKKAILAVPSVSNQKIDWDSGNWLNDIPKLLIQEQEGKGCIEVYILPCPVH